MNIKMMMTIAKNTIVKYSPEILMGTGAVAGIAGVVTACKQTLTVKDVVDPYQARIEEIRNSCVHDADKKELGKTYLQMSGSVVKHYLLPAALLGISLTSFCGAYKVLSYRNATLAAAYGNLLLSYTSLKDKVANKYGDQALYDLTHDTIVNEDGTVEHVTNEAAYGGLTVTFGPTTSDKAKRDAFYNRELLMDYERSYNIISMKRDIFVNEILTDLGLTPVKDGQVLCIPKGNGVSFGIENYNDAATVAFLNGEEDTVDIHFDCLVNGINRLNS